MSPETPAPMIPILKPLEANPGARPLFPAGIRAARDAGILRHHVRMPALIVDLGLASRLEGAGGAACARFVEARALVDPAGGAEWRDRGR